MECLCKNESISCPQVKPIGSSSTALLVALQRTGFACDLKPNEDGMMEHNTKIEEDDKGEEFVYQGLGDLHSDFP